MIEKLAKEYQDQVWENEDSCLTEDELCIRCFKAGFNKLIDLLTNNEVDSLDHMLLHDHNFSQEDREVIVEGIFDYLNKIE